MPRAAPSPGVFISYRRDDSAGFAGRLYDRLAERFGAGRVFMDIDAIQPGHEFAADIEQALSECSACVVLIGRDWESIASADGRRRLDDPTDFVRLEVAAAVRRGVAVFPVLVDGATPPSAASLPQDIRAISGRQAIELSNERWNYDVGRLLLALDEVVGTHQRKREPGTRKLQHPGLVAGTAFLVMVAVIVAWLATRPGSSNAAVFSGTYDVTMRLKTGFTGDDSLAPNNLWGKKDPKVGDLWNLQEWHLTPAGSRVRLVVPSPSKSATFVGAGGTYTDTSGTAQCLQGPPTKAYRVLVVTYVTDAQGIASFKGTFTIHWQCAGQAEVQAPFDITGTRRP